MSGNSQKSALVIRMFPFAVSFVATFGATYLQLNPPDDGVPTKLALALAAAIALGPGFGIWFERMHQRDAEYGEKVEASVVALHDSMTTLGKFNNSNIGYTVFRLRRSPRSPIRGSQVRIYRLRLGAKPKPSTVRWTWKKGLLGQCWAERTAVYLDHQKHFSGIRADMKWRDVPKETRLKLSRSEYLSIREYRHVVAFPIIGNRDGDYLGCLAVQVEDSASRKLLCPNSATAATTEWRKVIDKSLASIADLLG